MFVQLGPEDLMGWIGPSVKMDWLVSSGGAVVNATCRQRAHPRAKTGPSRIEPGHRGHAGRHNATATARVWRACWIFAPSIKACIMRRIGLLQYGGTAPLNQARYTIQIIPTLGSIGSACPTRGRP